MTSSMGTGGATEHRPGDVGSAALTKVLVPRRRRGTVTRRRLLDALHRHLDKRLHLVVAPAGYGKTTVLVDFAHEATSQGIPVCWLTLDEGDADARSLFDHLLLSLRQRLPGFGARTAALPRGVDDAGREHKALATALCNELVEHLSNGTVAGIGGVQASEPATAQIVLIFDDLHTIGRLLDPPSGSVPLNDNSLTIAPPDSAGVTMPDQPANGGPLASPSTANILETAPEATKPASEPGAAVAALKHILRRLPPEVHVVLAGRWLPAGVDLTAMRAAGLDLLDLAGLGVAQLRLDADEAAAIGVAFGVDAAADTVDAAIGQSEGWIMALLLSLRAPEARQAAGLLRPGVFDGDHDPFFGYLADQVYAALPDARRRFLTEAAVLPVLSAAACDAVLGRSDSAPHLAAVAAAHLFVDALDRPPEGEPAATEGLAGTSHLLPGTTSAIDSDPRPRAQANAGAPLRPVDAGPWFRLHPLWRAFLLDRLSPISVRHAVLRRAAARYELACDNVAGAVEHLLAIPDGTAAADLLERIAERELSTGRAERFWVWTQRLGSQVLDARPVLLLAGARALRRMNRIEHSLLQTERAEQRAKVLNRGPETIWAGALKAQLFAILGRHEEGWSLLLSVIKNSRRVKLSGELRARLFKEACLAAAIMGRIRESLVYGDVSLGSC